MDLKAPSTPERPETLTRVLGQSKHVKDVVEECAGELSSVNAVLAQELVDRNLQPAVEHAVEKNEAIAGKVQEASEELTAVNRALAGEIRAAKQQEVPAHHASFHDPLTGLPNRALFNDRLEHGFAQAIRHGWVLAVLYLDLDKLKSVNDAHGHAAGDHVLQTVAQRLKEHTRDEDTLGRVGGDEFLYLLTEIRDEGHIAMVARKLIEAIQAPIEVSVDEIRSNVRIRASVGISIYPKHGTTVDTLVISADLAMHKAKQSESGYAFAS